MPINQTLPGGSFGTAIGGSDALKEAMQRRGMDTSALDQMSPAVGGTQVSEAVPETNPQMGALPPAVPEPQKPPVSMRSGEMEIALKALAGVVSTEKKIAERSLGL